jgi:hypothetical protein
MSIVDLKSQLSNNNQSYPNIDLSKLNSNLDNFTTSYPSVNIANLNSNIPHNVPIFNDALDLSKIVTKLEKQGTSIKPFGKIQ